MRVIDKASVVLAVVLLCQIVLAQFPLECFADAGHIGELRTAKAGEDKQLSMVVSTTAVLIEAKRSDPIGRAESIHQQFDQARLHRRYQSLEKNRNENQSRSQLHLVKKGYWLINCALLL